MKRAFLIALLAVTPTIAMADGVDGVWKTEPGDGGGYLEITIANCGGDASKKCGTITRAYNAEGVDPGYANLGRLIIKDMAADGADKYSGGTIWDPQRDKTYDAEMTLHGDTLDVEGCVSIICKGQHWARVN